MELEYYRELARIQDSHWWYRGRAAVVRRVLTRHLPTAPARRRILDVGCGPGAMFDVLDAFGDAEGVDVSDEAVALATARGHRVTRYDGTVLPFDDQQFDVVTAFDVIEHIRDDRATLRELRRATRPGGRIVVTVPALPRLWSEHDEISHHVRRYTHRSLRAAVEAAGLEIVHLSAFNALLLAPIAFVRIALPRRGTADRPRSDFDRTPNRIVNEALFRIMAAEAPLVAGPGLPIGVSLLLVAKP